MLIHSKLTPRASELKACFYCDGTLPASSKEHIFNSCWGGKHKTSQLICDKCNEDFSHIDGVFGYAVNFVMNALSIKGERHSAVPEITGDNNIKLAAGASPQLADPTLELDVTESGYSIHVKANSKKQAKQLVLDGKLEEELQRPLSDGEKKHLLQEIRKIEKIRTFGATMGLNLSTDVKHEFRSAAHTMLKCLGMFEPEFVTNNASKSIRNFARYGQGNWEDFAITLRKKISLVEIFANDLGNFNAVEIYFSRSLGKVIGTVSILGHIKRSVVLAGYDGLDRIITIIEIVGKSHPMALLFEFESQMSPVPMIEIDPDPPTGEDIVRDSVRVIGNAVSWSAVANRFLDSLKQIVHRHPILDAEAVSEIREVLIEVGCAISVIYRVAIDEPEMSRLLEDLGIGQLASMIGNPAETSDFQDTAGRIFMEVANLIRDRASQASATPQAQS